MLPFTLHQLRILKAIATEKTFTKAAEILYLSQPSLSKQIKKLEESLDVILLNREHNKISLTEDGKIFLEYSERILALCEESCRILIDLRNGDSGYLIIGASQTIGTYLMPKILTGFTLKYPHIDLNIEIDSTRAIVEGIINNEIDIAVVGGEIPDHRKKNLIIEHFAYDELKLIVSKSHPAAKSRIININDLYCLDFITLNYNSSVKKLVDKILIHSQIQPNRLNIILELNSIEGIKTAVSSGLGAAFVSASAIEKELELELIEVVQIENLQIIRNISIISNSGLHKSSAFNFFYEDLIRLRTQSKRYD